MFWYLLYVWPILTWLQIWSTENTISKLGATLYGNLNLQVLKKFYKTAGLDYVIIGKRTLLFPELLGYGLE